MERKRLLYVVNQSTYFIRSRLALADAARAEGYEVHVATPRGSDTDEISAAGFPWHPIELTRSGLNPLRESRALLNLAGVYKRIRPDLVHHIPSKTVVYGTLAARMAAIPCVVNTIAGLGHIFISTRPLDRAVRFAAGSGFRIAAGHPHARLVFHNSDDAELFLANKWARQGQTRVVPGSGVDTQRFQPTVRENRRKPVVLLPSRILFTKGVAEFVEAARALADESSHARFALVGPLDDGNPASVPRETLDRWVSDGTVEYWGMQDDMARVLGEADVVCLPSYREGLSKALLESAAAGLPIVTTDTPGCREVVRHGDNGFLVPVRDSAALTDALRKLLLDPQLRAKMGARSRERAVAEFAIEKVLAANLAVYRELLGSAPGLTPV